MSKYDEVLKPFVHMMETELHANAGKGDRPGWLLMSADTCLLEIYYHLSKLQKSVKDDNGEGIREYAADVANMSMMLVDICGELFLDTENIHRAGSVEVLGRKNWQDECLKRGFEYVRESDDHYVTATPEQMADLLREVLGIDVRRPQGCDYTEPAPVPPAGDVEVQRWEPENTIVGYNMKPTPSGSFVLHDQYFRDFTRLTAERDGLLEAAQSMDSMISTIAKAVGDETGLMWQKIQRAFLVEIPQMKSELTKARGLLRRMTTDYACCLEAGHERITALGGDCDSVEKMLDDNRDYAEARAFLATPIAHNVDESCGQDAEAAKGGA